MEQFHEAWYGFLTAAKSVYTALETGSKVSPQSKQWYGGKARERRDDELLQYVYQARNDDEHGLGAIVEQVPGSLSIGVAKPGYSNAIQLDGFLGPGGTLKVTSLDNLPVLTEITPSHVALVAVDARGVIYQPPTKHLGNPLASKLPLPVAELMIVYLEGLITEASGLA